MDKEKKYTVAVLMEYLEPGRKVINLVPAISLFIAALVHIATFIPEAWRNVFPVHEIVLLDFYSRARLVVANSGDYDYFLSHISYRHAPYSDEVRNEIAGLLTGDNEAELKNFCMKFYLSSSSVDSDSGIVDTPSTETAGINCAKVFEEARGRLNRIAEDITLSDAWVVGEKNRTVGQTLTHKQTLEFDITENRWASCPYINPIDSRNNTPEEVMKRAEAFWAFSYQNFPGDCMEAEYFYKKSRNYAINVTANHWFELASISSQAAMHYSIMESKFRQSDAALFAVEGDYQAMGLPEIVSNFKYRNSLYCAALIHDFIGIETAPLTGGSDCLGNE